MDASRCVVIEELTKVLGAAFKCAQRIADRGRQVSQERQQLALLTVQFCFAGIAKTGEDLLALAGAEPLQKLRGLSKEELRDFNAMAQRHISIQLGRLQKLHALLQDQVVLELFDVSLRSEIEEAIGDKERGLYNVGAGLLYYMMLLRPAIASQAPEDLERTADILSALYPEVQRGIIAVEPAIKALESLREVNARYAEVLHRIIPAEAALRLSAQASKLGKVDS
jgi:hypothetical protein